MLCTPNRSVHRSVVAKWVVSTSDGNKEATLSESFGDDCPQIDFGDGSLLIYSHLDSLPDGQTLPPFDLAKLEAWDRSRANIRSKVSPRKCPVEINRESRRVFPY